MRTSKKYSKLVKWLNDKPRDSDDVFTDPGYGYHYKAWFGIQDTDKIFYKQNDIDHKLNTDHQLTAGLVLVDENENENENKKIMNELTQFVDLITDDTNHQSITDHQLITDQVFIPPGSNHSNCNYLYKRMVANAYDLEPYEIPYVSADPSVPYTGYHKHATFKINKEDFYNFVRENSAHS